MLRHLCAGMHTSLAASQETTAAVWVLRQPMQVVLDQLYAEHGEDPATWPQDVLASLGRRQAELSQQVSLAPRA